MIDLYAAPTSNGLRAKIMLDECGLPYTLRPVDLAVQAQLNADYLEINPMGLIPTIVDHEGPDGKPLTLSQSIAILTYLAEKSGKFMPPHLAKDAIFWRDIYSIATDMTGVLASMMAITRMKEPHEPTMDEFGKRFNRYLEYWDGLMADRKFAAGGEVTIADFAFYPVVYRAKTVTPEYTQGCGNVDRWYAEIHSRPGVQKGVDFA